MRVSPVDFQTDPGSPPRDSDRKVRRWTYSKDAFHDLFQRRQTVDSRTDLELQRRFVRRLDENGSLVEFELNCPLEELQGVGDGVYFYFFYLRYWIIICGILMVLTLPSLVINSLGNGLKSLASINVLLATSLGNTPIATEGAGDGPASSTLAIGYRVIYFLHVSFEILFCLTIFVGRYVFRMRLKNEIYACKLRSSSVNKYSLMVNLRPFPEISEDQLREFFGQFGEVVHVFIARDFKGTLPLLMDLGNLAFKYEGLKEVLPPNPQKIERLRQEINEKTERIKAKLEIHTLDLDVISALRPLYGFITFNFQKSAIVAKQTLEKAYQVSFGDVMCCQPPHIPPELLIDDQMVHTSIPDHPDNIYYENLEVTRWTRCWRLGVFLIASLIILLLSVFLSIMISAWGTSESVSLSCSLSNYTLDDVNATTYNQTLYSEVLSCYCAQFPLRQLADTPDLYDLCKSFYVFTLRAVGITIATSVSVAVINSICYQLVSFLTKWVGNNSRAERVERKIHFAFILQFFNTAFVSFLVYGVFGSYSIVDSINTMFGRKLITLPDHYTDLDRNWYNLVGIKVILPVLIGIIVPSLTSLLFRALGFLWRKFRARGAETIGKYLKARNPPQFPLEANYVKVQVMMFTALTFSAGIPLLIWFLFACMALAYWADKVDLLRFSRKPPLFSEELISSINNYTPFALILHLLFAIVFVSDADIFPSQYTFDYGLARFLEPITSPFFRTVLGRAYQSLPLTILLLLFLAVFIAEQPLLPLFDACTLKPEVAKFEGDEFSYRESYERIKHFSLPNYNLKLNPKYERFLKLFAAKFDEQNFAKQQRDVFQADESQTPIEVREENEMAPGAGTVTMDSSQFKEGGDHLEGFDF